MTPCRLRIVPVCATREARLRATLSAVRLGHGRSQGQVRRTRCGRRETTNISHSHPAKVEAIISCPAINEGVQRGSPGCGYP